jgi:DNA-binding CsgD family transcriptional regulator
VATLEPVARGLEQYGIVSPSTVHHAENLIDAYLLLGRRDAAARAIDRLSTQAERCEDAWGRAVAARGRAVLVGEGELDGPLEEALALARALPMPFTRARTELALGERLAAKGRNAARDLLDPALATFRHLDASGWAARAGRALGQDPAAPSGPQSRLAALTPYELQVAVAVADGATNREATAALFLSPKTIEYHLSRVYAKLGVRNRVELARLMSSGREQAGR